jgi:hypothetical protein
MNIVLLIVMIVYALIVLVVIVRLIYQFHSNSIDESIYEAPLYLYTMLSPIALVGLPLVSSSIFMYIIFAVPIGLLFLIILFNRNF